MKLKYFRLQRWCNADLVDNVRYGAYGAVLPGGSRVSGTVWYWFSVVGVRRGQMTCTENALACPLLRSGDVCRDK